jgi:hypothetical protein
MPEIHLHVVPAAHPIYGCEFTRLMTQIAAEDYKSKADERGDRAAELREKKFMEEQVSLCYRAARMTAQAPEPGRQPGSTCGHAWQPACCLPCATVRP